MRIIATIARPSSGTISWNGADIARQPDNLRRVLGYLPQDFGVYPNLNADLAGERIVMLSTHIVSDVEATATSIALIANGRLLRHALPEELLQAVAGKVWGWLLPSDELTAVRQTHRVVNTIRRPDGAFARIVSDSAPHPDADPLPPSLEDAYLYFVAQRPETTP